MTRELLLEKICFGNCVYDCVFYGSCECDYCKVKLNELLDEYDKHVIEQYKANTGLNDTIREIHDNVAQEMYCKGIDDMCKEIGTYRMYDEYGNVIDVSEIAEKLKAGVKNE